MHRLYRQVSVPLALALVGYFGYSIGQAQTRSALSENQQSSVSSDMLTPPTLAAEPVTDAETDDGDEAARPAALDAAPTEQSAVVAALRFLDLTEDVVTMPPTEGGELQRSISTEASADRLAADVEATLADVARSVPEGLTVHVAPLGTSVRPMGDGWEVSIWYAQVTVYGNELAVEQWRTATYTVEWEVGEWRMADLVSQDGPTPVRPASTVASPAAELIAATAGISDEGWAP